MECPCCGGDLHAGSIVIQADMVWLHIAGYSRMDAWFHSADGTRADQVVSCGRPEHALRCLSCGTVVIASEAVLARREERLELVKLVGAVGTAGSSLRPMGVVVMEGRTYAAKSESGYIEMGTGVEVIGTGTSELIVRAKTAEPFYGLPLSRGRTDSGAD